MTGISRKSPNTVTPTVECMSRNVEKFNRRVANVTKAPKSSWFQGSILHIMQLWWVVFQKPLRPRALVGEECVSCGQDQGAALAIMDGPPHQYKLDWAAVCCAGDKINDSYRRQSLQITPWLCHAGSTKFWFIFNPRPQRGEPGVTNVDLIGWF